MFDGSGKEVHADDKHNNINNSNINVSVSTTLSETRASTKQHDARIAQSKHQNTVLESTPILSISIYITYSFQVATQPNPS